MFFGKKLPVTWLVVGLGNPGDKYENTRHNAGFMAIDQLADRGDFPVQRLKFHALTHQATISGQGVLVMKPTTYMNLSGDAVAEAAAFYKVSPDHILVLCDDVSLPVGKLRIRTSGSAAGPNRPKHNIHPPGTAPFPPVKI